MAKKVDNTSMGLELEINESIPFILSNVNAQLEANQNNHSVSILYISGPPGIGKSDICGQICENNDFGLMVKYMGTMLIEQITGLPKGLTDNEVKFTEWTAPELFNPTNLRVDASNSERPIILLLDDAHLCNKTIQAYMFQLLTYRSIHDHKLPKNIVLLLAGNRSSDKAGFQQIMAPISNRIYFVNVKCDVEAWVTKWAGLNGVRTDIMAFLQNHPNYLQSTPMESKSWASPRSWTYASKMLDAFEGEGRPLTVDAQNTIMSGHIAPEYAGEFIQFRELLMKWQADKLLNKTKKMPDATKLNKTENYCLLTAVIGELMKRLRYKKYKLDKEMNDQIALLRGLIEQILPVCKEIIPLGLKLLILGEKEFSNDNIVVAKKLLTDEYLVDSLSKIIN